MPVFAGQRSSAQYWNAQADFGTYTPVLTAGTTNPNLGADGEAVGFWYRQGRLIRGFMRFLFAGAGVDPGSGQFRVSLPFPPDPSFNSSSGTGGQGTALGSGKLRDHDTGSNSRNIIIQLAILSPGEDAAIRWSASNANATDSNPVPWTTNDRIAANFTYIADESSLPDPADNQRAWRDGRPIPGPQSWGVDRVRRYTPQMFGSTGDPSFGTEGFALGWWRTNGFIVMGEMRFLFAGDEIVAPTGSFRFSLPVPFDPEVEPNVSGLSGGNITIAEGFVRDDNTPGSSQNVIGQIFTTQLGGLNRYQLIGLVADGSNASISYSFAAGDRIAARFMYPANKEIVAQRYT